MKNNNIENYKLGDCIAEWQYLSFAYDMTTHERLERISELEKRIKELEADGWRYEFKRENYEAYTICTRKYINNKLSFQGCINQYFETIEKVQRYMETMPIVENRVTYKHHITKCTRTKDTHKHYNINTSEEYITEQKY